MESQLLSLTLRDLQLVITGDMTGVCAMLLRAHPCVIAGRQVQESCRSSQQVWIKRKEHLQGADLQTEVVSEALQEAKSSKVSTASPAQCVCLNMQWQSY